MDWSNGILYQEENSEEVPVSAGIYKILAETENLPEGELRRVYLGQSDDLRKRYLEHLSSNEPNNCIKRLPRGFYLLF